MENIQEFVDRQVATIKEQVGNNIAINALSGGVDSSVVTVIGQKALGDHLRTFFIDNGLMRQKEPESIVSMFDSLGLPVILVNEARRFFETLKGITNPEGKREAITQIFYRDVFARLIKETGAKYLFQGTILTDIEETKAGIKRQHNVFKQIGIDPEQEFGYQIIEPLIELRKDDVRELARHLQLPKKIYNRQPFPGPALATRVVGEVTPEKIRLIRQVTFILESEFEDINAFQYLAILHKDRVTGMRNNKRQLGQQIEIRCWDSVDARTATPTDIPTARLMKLSRLITTLCSEIVSVTYNITDKPPSTIETI